jgi:predicted dehydrogenase
LEKTQTRAAEFGLRAYTNVLEMLEREKPDLVSLSLPNLKNFEVTMQVIQSGYPLLVEKPLAFDLREADQLLNEAAKRDLFFAINFNHRYAKPLRFASGAVGSMVGTYDSSYAYQDTHRLEINGTHGKLVVEDTVQRFCFQPAGNETAEVWQAGYFNDFDREFQRTFDVHLDAILSAFKSGDQPPVHARAGQRALELAWAAVESFSLGKRVILDPSKPAAAL